MDPREKATAAALADLKNFTPFRKVALTIARKMDVAFSLPTQDGIIEGKAGDYLCIDSDGQPYMVTAREFERTHELRSEPQLPAGAIVQVGGIPVGLPCGALVTTTEANWPLVLAALKEQGL